MEKVEVKTESSFTLPKKKIKISPIKRKGNWLPVNHEASFLFGSAKKIYTVPLKGKNLPAQILTDEEEEFLSKRINKNLSVYTNPKENFWFHHSVSLTKEIKILDLSDPMDYINYKILLANKDFIAPSGDEKFDKGTYKYFIDDVDYHEKKIANEGKAKMEAYKFFGQLTLSKTNMEDFLSAYYLNKPGKRVPLGAEKTWLEAELEKIISQDLDMFLSLSADKFYTQKVFLAKALSKKAVVREGSNFLNPEGDLLSNNFKEMLIWLKDDANAEEVLKLEARIDI